MALKIALAANDETRWIAVMPGPRVVVAPHPLMDMRLLEVLQASQRGFSLV